jgi:hypothetical protein
MSTRTLNSSSQTSVVPASMFRPAATDISGFGGGRGPERAGHSLQSLPAEILRTAKPAARGAASLTPSTSEPAYVGGRGQEHDASVHRFLGGAR